MARTQTVMAANVAQRADQRFDHLVKEQTRLIEAQDLGAVRLANLETAFAKFEVTLSSIQAQNDLAFKAMRSRAEDEREEFASHVVDALRLDLERYHRDSQERQTRELRGLLRRVLAQLDEPATEETAEPKP